MTSSPKSGTIISKGDVVALENQRYGRNKSTIVNKTYIESGEYRRKFDDISDNPEVNRALYECAKTALVHRSGTVLEDMYWIDENGKIVLSITDSTTPREITYTNSAKKIIQNRADLITIHNHSGSMPPSIEDFNSSCKHGYDFGVIACHNGKVFVYSSRQIINPDLYNLYMNRFISDGMSEYDAQTSTLSKLSENHEIDFWEV